MKEYIAKNIYDLTLDEETRFERCNVRHCTFNVMCHFDRCNIIECTNTSNCDCIKSNIIEKEEVFSEELEEKQPDIIIESTEIIG